jgi:transmembrane sensor
MTTAEAIEERAADWLARRDAGGWTPADEAAFETWLAEATAHRVAYLRLEAAWQEAGRLRALRGLKPAPAAKSWSRRLMLPVAAALVVAVGLSAALTVGWPTREEFETAIGGHETIPLTDGSQVELNTDSRLRVASMGEQRRVILEKGEAYFEIAKDPSRPFVVEAAGQRVTVLGTKFSVRIENGDLRVAVTEGRVRVDPQIAHNVAPVVLTPGAVARSGRDGVLVSRRAMPQLEEGLSWRSGMLIFSNATLGDAVADFNRYNRTKLVMRDPALGRIEIGGSFRATNVEGFVRLLETGFDVKAARQGDTIVLTKR